VLRSIFFQEIFMDSVEVSVDVYVDVNEFFSKLDDDPLIEEIRSRGYLVLSENPQPNDHAYVATLAECVVSIVSLFKSDETRMDGIKLIKAVSSDVLASL